MIPADIIRKVNRIRIRTRKAVIESFAGHYHSVFKGQGIEFHEVREYYPGDDIRWIDWNVTARMGHPYVKKFIEERELTVMLLLDLSRSLAFGSGRQLKRETAAEVAAVLAFSAVLNSDRVGAVLFTDRVELFTPPRKDTRHVLRMIRDILFFEPRSYATRLSTALEFLNRVTRRRSTCFLISDFLTEEDFYRPLSITAQRHDLVAIRILDPRELTWPKCGLVEWEDLETGNRCLTDTASRHVRQVFSRSRLSFSRRLRETFASQDIDFLELRTDEPYDQALLNFFRLRELRYRR
ncbi:MAG TPA: DUF58 domain-containing protein [Kiritimatiellae bacterium]|nr:DUF58 domain-containing protein [Kiritimatiellia bacterium]